MIKLPCFCVWTSLDQDPFAMARKASNRDETSNAVPDLDLVVREIADEMRQRPDRGEVATYIPELARVDPKGFGLKSVGLAYRSRDNPVTFGCPTSRVPRHFESRPVPAIL